MNYLYLGAGVFTIACTYFKPNFYWNSRKALGLRKIIGDTATSVFYYGLGLFLAVMSLKMIF